jgi:pimeloyl-ACP methyl ester carboxylesterase
MRAGAANDRRSSLCLESISPWCVRGADVTCAVRDLRQGRLSMADIAVAREGSGPEVLFVHGGASPATTWAGLERLARRWTLTFAYRRGYPPSPPAKQDFEVDASDLVPLLDSRPHLVAHSYGVLGALLAAARRPEDVSSLTLIEPPLYHLAGDDPGVARLKQLGDAALLDGLDADPTMLREFLRLAGAKNVDDGPLPEDVARGVRRAHGGRLPGEANPPLHVLRGAGIQSLVASGRHHEALERICDALAVELAARRIVVPGAGHFVPAAPGFADQLDRFLTAAARR